VNRQDVRRARDDLGAFAALVGRPLTSWQLEALKLATWLSVIVAPRQSGKSRALSVLACHHAYRHPRSLVLIVSAGEVAARRLLAEVRSLAAHPLLRGSVVDESTYSVTLSNGATIRCTPSSERQIRGWAVDLLLVDEAAVISDELLAAALPTTAARPDARVVMASSPWSDAGPFYAAAQRGFTGDPTTRAFRWKLTDCAWISAATIEAARATLSPLRFAAEYEGAFVGGADAYFPREDLLACTADYPLARLGNGTEPVTAGLDWGRARDAHAVVLAGVAHDYGVNGRPVVVLPWVETSRRPYGAQVAEVAALAGSWRLVAVHSETNGVGAFPTEELTRLLRARATVTPVASSQASKENGYGRLATMLSRREIVLPAHEELIRQLGGVTATPTPSGGLRIAAVTEAVHDDLPDAAVLAVTGLPSPLLQMAATDPPADVRWVETPEGVRVPVPVRTRRAHVSATIGIPQGRALPGMIPREGIAGEIERAAWAPPVQPQRTWPGW
jgi:hypothetical protein